MKILQVSSTDLVGQRFNGQDIIKNLNRSGRAVGNQLVWIKDGVDPNTQEMLRFAFSRIIQKTIDRIEHFFSLRAIFHWSSFLLAREPYFKAADVVHYHLIYWPNFFSILALPFLTRLKPSVWTIHDLWPVTGHCVYPFDCEKYLSGCGKCPSLKVNFALRKDRTAFAWKLKKFIYARSKLHLVVASRFMYDRVSKSPLLGDKPVSLIPFGLDLKKFSPGDSVKAKKLFGIEADEITISFRATLGEFKGFEYIRKVLHHILPGKKICLLTFNSTNLVEEFRSRFKIVDLGWVQDEEVMLNAYHASDFFLMPSTQEAFGMMAMEAMACAKPVIVFDGTSLPEVVGGPEIGIVVKRGDLNGFADAINRLIYDDAFRLERGQKARAFAEKNYDFELHVERLLEVYQKISNKPLTQSKPPVESPRFSLQKHHNTNNNAVSCEL